MIRFVISINLILILIIIFIALGSSVSFSQDKSIEELYFQGVYLLENEIVIELGSP